MSRSYAVSLGALAMGLVVLRGAIQGESAPGVATESIVAMGVFMCVGGIAGWIMDHLVQDSIRRMFHSRVDWYRQGMIEAGYIEQDSSAQQSASTRTAAARNP